MATPWPQDEIWRTDYREHATNLSKYLQKALSAIDSGNGQPIASHGVRVALIESDNVVLAPESINNTGSRDPDALIQPDEFKLQGEQYTRCSVIARGPRSTTDMAI
ncbi:hypothetical protein FoTM2_009133 [Fusarium oxysporum f. sp. vasinfectum]|nr:hypothetical protein FoTM2_009133 [Fusarium oxysporum f. sp. vasinfectum]